MLMVCRGGNAIDFTSIMGHIKKRLWSLDTELRSLLHSTPIAVSPAASAAAAAAQPHSRGRHVREKAAKVID